MELNNVGVYIAIGIGLLLALWVLWELWSMTRKQCPDCARSVEKSANVCSHCGYRFAPAPEGTR
jgi:predicted amidophosphoribosyltransferase